MLTVEKIAELSQANYVRKASVKNDYWVDFSKGRLDKYLHLNIAFNIIIYSEINSSENYYIIPYQELHDVFTVIHQSQDKKGRKRWVGTIQNHKLKISNYPSSIDISRYYENLIENNTSLLHICEEDINSLKQENSGFEGSKKEKLVNYYERNPKLRTKAIEIHGTICKVCGFDFETTYGIHGKNYIEVHHLKALRSFVEPSLINPLTDLTVLCANCHRMVHRKRDSQLSIETLKRLIKITS